MTRKRIAILLIAVALSACVCAASAAAIQVRYYLDGELMPVYREVPDGVQLPVAAVEALIAGPTMEEAAQGYESAIPLSAKLVKAALDGETLSVDMSAEVLKGLDEARLFGISKQFHSTVGDFPAITAVQLTCKGQLLSTYLPVSEPVGVSAPTVIPKSVGLAGLGGRNITIGPSHGRFWNGSGWYWQRTDPCGYGEAVLEDTNSIRLMQFLYQYLTQDGATVHVPRELNESHCCNPYEGLPYWKMAAYSWLRSNGLPCSVWASYTGNCGEETATGRNSDDIRARPKFADYRGSEIYIAHHTNPGGGTGMETFRDTAMEYPAHETNSYNLALSVHNNTMDAIHDMYDGSFANRGVKDAAGGFGEIRIPNRPACLVELAFHDKCDKDAIYLTDDFFRSVAMWGMYNGICAYFGTSPTWDKYSCEYVSDTIPSTMTEGQSYTVSVTFRNRGVLWREGRAFRLGAAGDSDPFTGSTRFTISGDVRPGNTYTFTFTMTAPAPGTYTTDWQMVRDGVAWFGSTHSETVTVIPSHNYQKGWLLIGPYTSTSIETNSLGVDEASLWASSAVSLNGDSWQSHDSAGSYVDLDSVFGTPNGVTAYAWSYVYTATTKNVYMFTGSDDQIRIWLNGVKVHEYLSPRGHAYDANSTPVTLNAGWNRLLVKVHDETSAFGFSLRFADNAAGSTDTTGLTWRKDDWTPTLQLSTINGAANNPAPGAQIFANNPSVAVTGTAGMSGGPATWTVRTRSWGSNNIDPGPGWLPVGTGSTTASWSHTATQAGHVRHHFQTLSQTGRASTQWNNTGGSNYFDMFVDNAAPGAPAITTATPAATSVSLALMVPLDSGSGPSAADGATESINSSSSDVNANWYRAGAVGVQVRRGATSGTVVADWGANTSATDNSLTPNTAYSYYIQARDNTAEARGAWHNYTDWQGPVATRTLAETPTLTIGAVTEATIAAQTSGALTNAPEGQTATIVLNQTDTTDSGWTAGAHTSWISTGLQSNVTYTLIAKSRNADGVESPASAAQAVCTLPPAPTAENVTCDRSTGQMYAGDSAFTFTNTLGFGTGGKPSALNYTWNTQPTHTFDGSEQAWTSGGLALYGTSSNSWYLHVQSENSEGTPNSVTLTLGPYLIRVGKPLPPRLVTGTGANGIMTLTWIKGEGAQTTVVEKSGSGSGPWASASTAEAGQTWTDPSTYALGQIVYYRLTSADELDQLSENNPIVAVLNSFSGVNMWNYSTGAAALAAPSVLVQTGTVFAGSNDRRLHSFLSSDGLPRFTPAETGGAISGRPPVSPYVAGYTGQLVFTGSQDTYVYAYNAADGQPVWSVSLGSGNQIVGKVAGQIWAPVTAGPFAGQTRTLILAPTYNTSTPTGNMLVALDGATGQEAWRFAPGNLDIIPGSPAINTAANIAVFASYAGVGASQPSLWALDTTNGQMLWSLTLGHISGSPTTSLDGAAVYVASDAGVLYKVNTTTGQVVWSFPFGGEPYGAPWVHYTGSMLFLADEDGKVWSILDQGSSAAINPAWGSGSGYAQVQSPSQVVLSDIAGKMYVGASDGKIWELSETTGAGSYILIASAVGDPVVHRQASRLMFGSASGRIHCLTIPFVRCDELRIFGLEMGTGLLYPDGPFGAYDFYGLRARATWRGLGPGAHVQTTRWWTPSGHLYQQFTTAFSAPGDGYPQQVSVDVPLAGTGAQRLLGQWKVEVFLDDTTTVQGTRYFILQ